MTVYLLNSAVMTGYGTWNLDGPISRTEARKLISDGFESAIGHEGAAQYLSEQLACDVKENRRRIEMEEGDIAIVLRSVTRLDQGQVLDHGGTQDAQYELALLTRIE